MYKYLILIFLICIGACSDSNGDYYSTYWEAKDAKIFSDGWLPDILPTTTTRIIVKNNKKLNTSKGSFKIREADVIIFTKHLMSTITFGGKEVYYYWGPNNEVIWNFYIRKNGYVTYDFQETLLARSRG